MTSARGDSLSLAVITSTVLLGLTPPERTGDRSVDDTP